MHPEDVEPVIDVCAAALWGEVAEADRPRQRHRIEHLLATDPDGAFVAEHDGRPVGVSMGLIREDVWGLSLLAVAEERRGTGAGRRLVEAAVAYGASCRGGIVLSSEHPAAMRSYARAGFALRPSVALSGLVTDPPAPPAGVAELAEPAPWMDDVARVIRGAAYGTDVDRQMADGARLRAIEGRGWMLSRAGEVKTLVASDEEAATDLLSALLAEAAVRGETADVSFVTAGQDWAVRTGLRAGLALSTYGPVFTRGSLGPLRPWLPSGAFL